MNLASRLIALVYLQLQIIDSLQTSTLIASYRIYVRIKVSKAEQSIRLVKEARCKKVKNLKRKEKPLTVN